MIDVLLFIIEFLDIIANWRFVVAFGLSAIPAFLLWRFQLAGHYSNLLAILFLFLGTISGIAWQVKHKRQKIRIPPNY